MFVSQAGCKYQKWPTPCAALRCDTLPDAFPTERVPARGTARVLASVTRGIVAGRIPMRNFLLTTCVGAVAIFAMGAAHANDELIKMSQNPKDWVMPTGNYANQRYSQLKQITAQNRSEERRVGKECRTRGAQTQ